MEWVKMGGEGSERGVYEVPYGNVAMAVWLWLPHCTAPAFFSGPQPPATLYSERMPSCPALQADARPFCFHECVGESADY